MHCAICDLGLIFVLFLLCFYFCHTYAIILGPFSTQIWIRFHRIYYIYNVFFQWPRQCLVIDWAIHRNQNCRRLHIMPLQKLMPRVVDNCARDVAKATLITRSQWNAYHTKFSLMFSQSSWVQSPTWMQQDKKSWICKNILAKFQPIWTLMIWFIEYFSFELLDLGSRFIAFVCVSLM